MDYVGYHMIQGNGNDLKEEIIKLLAKSPAGMTILSISKALHTSRHTISKYVFHLTEVGTIECYEVGRAKLCVLKRGKR